MKRLIMASLIVLISMTSITGAQILLEPESSGHVKDTHKRCAWATWYGYNYGSSSGWESSDLDPSLAIGRAYSSSGWQSGWTFGRCIYTRTKEGSLEFNLQSSAGGGPMPATWMTAYNWTAQIHGLKVAHANPPGEEIRCKMFDKPDE